MDERPIHRRILVGGCSRSGTTFLQRLLAGHSRIQTFPETGVFLRALGMRGTVLPWARLGLTIGKERKALLRLLDQLGLDPSAAPPLPPRRLLLRSSVGDIVKFLDALAQGVGKDLWLEKTPRHVLHASRIRRLVPGSVFLHILRDGRDVVASIVDRARKHPDQFHGQADPAYGIRQWNRSMEATRQAMGEEGHVVVRYETLAGYPEETLRALSDSLGIEFEEGMLAPADSRGFVLEEEAWKKPLDGPIRPALSKFESLFDEATKTRIDEGLELGFLEEVNQRLTRSSARIWVSEGRN